jgi:hypothetical protein
MFVVEEFDFNHDYIKRSDTRDAGEKDVETASIETSVVDTKATEAKKEHEARVQLWELAKHFRLWRCDWAVTYARTSTHEPVAHTLNGTISANRPMAFTHTRGLYPLRLSR